MIRVRSWVVLSVALLLAVALVAASAALAAEGKGPGGMMARTGSLIGLLSNEKVQKELKLTDEQIEKVKQVAEKVRGEMREKFSGLRDIQDAKQRRAKMTEIGNQADAQALKELGDALPREKRMRLFQIRLQVRGAAWALTNARTAERLKLTDEQKKKAADIENAAQEKTFEVFGAMRNLSEDERREKMAETGKKIQAIRAEANKKALELLTAEQKESFEKMKGEKFEL
jgi:Spy/CpxP family protein refolding chaperone